MNKIKIFKISIISLIFILISNNDVFSQRRIKYKDVFEIVQNGKREAAYSMLWEHQKQNPEHANTYFQLGIISQYWSKEYDALTETNEVKYFIYNTKLFYGLAKGKLNNDQSDVRKNRKYYQNGQFANNEDLEFEDVNVYLTSQLKVNEEYSRNVDIITNLYNKTVDHYNNCTQLFREINSKNSKIKDIYMTADVDFVKKLKTLSSSFDSTLFYFQEFKTAIKNYPIKNYDQQLQIRPIVTYRLDGLTSSDFLNNTIYIWDYASWVKDVNKVLDNDIHDLREKIVVTNKEIALKTEQLVKTELYTNQNDYKVDEKVVYKINKYDFNSLMIHYFSFQQAKINFLIKYRNTLNNILLKEENLLSKRSRYYFELLESKENVDSLNNVFYNQISAKGIEKYKDFFKANFKDMDGLKDFSKNETKLINSFLDQAYENYKYFILNEVANPAYDTTKFSNKGMIVNLKKQDINIKKADPKLVYTTNIEKDKNGNLYVAGYFSQNGSTAGFVAKTIKTEKIDWFKAIDFAQATSEFIAQLKVSENGCAFLVTSMTDTVVKNQLLKWDEKGNELFKKELDLRLIPQYLAYDDINENYLIAYKGRSFAESEISEKQTIQFVSTNAPELSWNSILNVNGSVFDVVKMDKNYFIFTNFTKYSFENDTYTTTSNRNNVLLSIFDEKGKIVKMQPFNQSRSATGVKALKINSNTINVVGLFSEPLDFNLKNANSLKLYNLLINKNGEIVYTN